MMLNTKMFTSEGVERICVVAESDRWYPESGENHSLCSIGILSSIWYYICKDDMLKQIFILGR